MRWRAAFLFSCLLWSLSAAAEQVIRLGIHPVLPPDHTRRFYEPLRAWLQKATGFPVELSTSKEFASHFFKSRHGQHDVALDSHVATAWLVQHAGWRPLAKIAGSISYAVVAPIESGFFDKTDLQGKLVGVTAPPSMAWLAAKEMFDGFGTNRKPVLVEVSHFDEAYQMVKAGKLAAAVIPSPLTGRYPDMNVLAVTAMMPHAMFAIRPGFADTPAGAAVVQAFEKLALGSYPEVAQQLDLAGFEPVRVGSFEQQASLLKKHHFAWAQ